MCLSQAGAPWQEGVEGRREGAALQVMEGAARVGGGGAAHAARTAVQGCTVVFHTASPVSVGGVYGPQAQRELVEPAVQGTESVLRESPATLRLPAGAH